MANARSYNVFYPWVQQDDFLTNWANFIEHKNIDWLRDWFWVTLWPKMNKQLFTGTKEMLAIYSNQNSGGTLTDTLVWGASWNIYYLNSTDNIPEFALIVNYSGVWDVNVAITNIELLKGFYYIFYKQNYADSLLWCARISQFDARTGNWMAMVKNYIKSWIWLANSWIPPIIQFDNALYVWSGTGILKVDGNYTPGSATLPWANVFGFPEDVVTWLSLQGTTVVVYTRQGTVYFWDGVDTTYQAVKKFGARVQKVGSKAGTDYVITEDGQFSIWGGLQFFRVTKPKKSNRMNSNVNYDSRLKFNVDADNASQNHTVIPALDDMYMYSSDTVKWIYKYGKLIPWMPDGFHKIITQNHAGTQIDFIYDMFFYEIDSRKLYISYKAGSTYWIDYIDLNTLQTSIDGYFITDVFTWWSNIKKKVIGMQMTTSNTAWNNFVKLYYRVNNWAWELIRTYNEPTNVITQDDIKTINGQNFKHFIDIQFKVEIHNDTGGQDAPQVHDLALIYDITE